MFVYFISKLKKERNGFLHVVELSLVLSMEVFIKQ